MSLVSKWVNKQRPTRHLEGFQSKLQESHKEDKGIFPPSFPFLKGVRDSCLLCSLAGEGNGNPLQYSCLRIPWKGAWRATRSWDHKLDLVLPFSTQPYRAFLVAVQKSVPICSLRNTRDMCIRQEVSAKL